MDHHFSKTLYQSTAPFSHARKIGGLWFISGIIGQRRDTGALAAADLGRQANAMFDNLETLLEEIGSSATGLGRVCLYLVDYAHFDQINAIYAERIPAPYPARTTLQTAALPLGAKVQIDAIVEA